MAEANGMRALSDWTPPAVVARGFGRKQGLLRHVMASAEWRLGWLRSLERIDWRRVKRWVFVCQGNICRSAYGAARARARMVPTASFGLTARDGDPAHPVAQAIARNRGVSLETHASTSLEQFDARAGDLWLVMEPRQARILESFASRRGAQLSLVGLWSKPARPYLEDPFGLGEPYFETCFSILDSAIDALARAWEAAGGQR